MKAIITSSLWIVWLVHHSLYGTVSQGMDPLSEADYPNIHTWNPLSFMKAPQISSQKGPAQGTGPSPEMLAITLVPSQQRVPVTKHSKDFKIFKAAICILHGKNGSAEHRYQFFICFSAGLVGMCLPTTTSFSAQHLVTACSIFLTLCFIQRGTDVYQPFFVQTY